MHRSLDRSRIPYWPLFLVTILVLTAVTGRGDEAADTGGGSWPQFLGPRRDGKSAETGLLDSWPDGGPREVWRVEGGVGMSGIAVGDGHLVTMTQDAQDQYVVSLDPWTGKRQWRAPVAQAYENQMGNGPRATPTIDGDKVYALTGEGIVCALELKSGMPVWSRNVVESLRVKPAEYGMSCSPLVVDGVVIVIGGGANGTVVALDVKTGEQVWAAGQDETGYSSPTVLELGGRRQVVAFTGSSALGVDPKSGQILWRYPFVTDYRCNIATPIAHDGRVLISSGENHGSALLTLKPSGEGFDIEETWTSLGTGSVLRSEWQTPILLDGYLYGMDNVGSAGPVTHLTCVKADTGERVWRETRFGKSNLIAADGKLFITTMKGELVVARATPRGYEELGRATVLGTTRQAPALASGLLYLRDDQEIVCLDVRSR